jgi:Omp85 superfamily domain
LRRLPLPVAGRRCGAFALLLTFGAGLGIASADDDADKSPKSAEALAREAAMHAWPADIPTGPELEEAGAVVGKVRVIVGDIFDPSIPGEGGWVYRTANKLHINTRAQILRKQLLFKEGQPYRHRIVQETERNLRTNDYLYDAAIRPIAWDGKKVDLEVRTRDTWTLNPGINFSRQGGSNSASVELEEKNLLGNGQHLAFGWESDVDREAFTFSFFDPHFHSTWTRLGVSYSDADDGQTASFRLDRPFYSFDTRHAGGMYLYDSERNDPRYAGGERVGEFQHDQQFYEAYGGVSAGWSNGWVTRWSAGVTYQQDQFAPSPDMDLLGPLPEDREFVYPWLGVDILQDAFQERVNQDQIQRTEDVLLGFRAGARLGYAPEALGSSTDAVLFNGYAQQGMDVAAGQSLFLGATTSGRVESEGLRDAVLSAEARYYAKTSKKTKFFATVNGSVAENLDLDTQLLLGGDTGLRGYPLRYQAGTALALLTLEERYYTDWYPFRLFHVGGAVFFDMGRTWGTDPATGSTSLGLLKDIGVGLRLGSSRSAFGNVIHIDLAFPLDGGKDIDSVQFVVETKAHF